MPPLNLSGLDVAFVYAGRAVTMCVLAIIVAGVAWWAINRMLRSFGAVSAIASYMTHRWWLRWTLLGTGGRGAPICFVCGRGCECAGLHRVDCAAPKPGKPKRSFKQFPLRAAQEAASQVVTADTDMSDNTDYLESPVASSAEGGHP